MNTQRLVGGLLGAPLAAAVTLSLLWFMQHLVMPSATPALTEPLPRLVDFIRLRREPPPPEPEKQEQSEPPEPEEAPPMPAQPRPLVPEPPPPQLGIAMPRLSLSPIKSDTRIMNGLHAAQELVAAPPKSAAPPSTGLSSDLIPLLRIEPRYPSRAALNGIEGWVKLAFTITEEGAVKDVRVLDAKPRRVFNRAATRAVRKWRFRPRLVDGQPVARSAIQVLNFQLEKGRG